MKLDDVAKLGGLGGAMSVDALLDLKNAAREGVERVRSRMLSPSSAKTAPLFSSSQVAELCGIDRKKLHYRVTKGDLPPGTLTPSGASREFTLPETRAWVMAHGVAPRRPAGVRGVTISIGNFKGGVTKTSTAMTLAQGLSLRGHRVLAVDLDPQGSLTTLFGLLPQVEIENMETFLGVVYDEKTLAEVIRGTYWDGVDLVPATAMLTEADFDLPSRVLTERGFEFWNVLNKALDGVRDRYDVIVIDTPPALSYLTLNAFYAADGLLVPIPPSAMDYCSAAQFWDLFADIAGKIRSQRHGTDKSYEFVRVLLAKVDGQDAAVDVVRSWVNDTYRDLVLPVEIPKTTVAGATAAEFGTLYDIARYDGSRRTYLRARDAYDGLVLKIEQLVAATWQKWRAGQGGSTVEPRGSNTGGFHRGTPSSTTRRRKG